MRITCGNHLDGVEQMFILNIFIKFRKRCACDADSNSFVLKRKKRERAFFQIIFFSHGVIFSSIVNKCRVSFYGFVFDFMFA